MRRTQREEAQFYNRELQNSTVPPQPLLCTAQVPQRDDVTTAEPQHDSRWDTADKRDKPPPDAQHDSLLSPDENMSVYLARNLNLKRISCSEGMLNHVGLSPGQPESMSKSCDDLTAKLEARLRQQREMRREMSRELNKEPPESTDLRDLKERPYWRYVGSVISHTVVFIMQKEFDKCQLSTFVLKCARVDSQNDVEHLATEARLRCLFLHTR